MGILGSVMQEWVFKERRLRSDMAKGRYPESQDRNAESEDVLKNQGQRKKPASLMLSQVLFELAGRDQDYIETIGIERCKREIRLLGKIGCQGRNITSTSLGGGGDTVLSVGPGPSVCWASTLSWNHIFSLPMAVST